MDILNKKKLISKEDFVLHMKQSKKEKNAENEKNIFESKIKQEKETKMKFRW